MAFLPKPNLDPNKQAPQPPSHYGRSIWIEKPVKRDE